MSESVDGCGRDTCAIGADGADFCWGNNCLGHLGDGTYSPSLVPIPIEP